MDLCNLYVTLLDTRGSKQTAQEIRAIFAKYIFPS